MENVIVYSGSSPDARKYLEFPLACNLVSYGNNIVASVVPEYEKIVRDYIDKYSVAHCFETPNMHVLNDAFSEHGLRVCFMAEYFLPDMDILTALSCPHETRVLEQADFADIYTEKWSNALSEKRRELDMLGVGAYDGDILVGLAACSADCDTMWQIGVDVLPEYRRQVKVSDLEHLTKLKKCLTCATKKIRRGDFKVPQIFRFGSYWVYFWTNENKPLEPVHVHIADGHPTGNATKIWITRGGKCYLCNNNSHILSSFCLNFQR